MTGESPKRKRNRESFLEGIPSERSKHKKKKSKHSPQDILEDLSSLESESNMQSIGKINGESPRHKRNRESLEEIPPERSKHKKKKSKHSPQNIFEDLSSIESESNMQSKSKSTITKNSPYDSKTISSSKSAMIDDGRLPNKLEKHKRRKKIRDVNISPDHRTADMEDPTQTSSNDDKSLNLQMDEKTNKKQKQSSNSVIENGKFLDTWQQKREKHLILSSASNSSEEDADFYDDLKNYETSQRMKGKVDLTEEAADIQEMLRILEDEEALPKDIRHKLRGLKVKLEHTPPPQHMVENSSGSRGPTPEQKELLEKLGPMKYGTYTPEEDDIIINNWKSFCKRHNWDQRYVKPFLYMRHRDAGFIARFSERQKFVQYLAQKLPHRTLYSVYWRFRNLYQPHLQTRYSAQEDALIKAHMENPSTIHEKNVRKFSELAKILNRTRASVWRRYRLMTKQKKISTGDQWDMAMVKKFLKNLMAITQNENIEQLKDVELPHVIWSEMANKLKMRINDLKAFWLARLHVQLFCKEPIYLNDVKIKLIEYFYVKGISKPREINWFHIAKDFDGMTPTFLCDVFNQLIDDTCKGMDWNEMIEYLYNVKKREIINDPNDRRLRRIAYENGNIVLVDEKPREKNARCLR